MIRDDICIRMIVQKEIHSFQLSFNTTFVPIDVSSLDLILEFIYVTEQKLQTAYGFISIIFIRCTTTVKLQIIWKLSNFCTVLIVRTI